MTERDRERLEKALQQRRQELQRWSAPEVYEIQRGGLSPAIDRIRQRLEKADCARAEIRALERKLNGGRR